MRTHTASRKTRITRPPEFERQDTIVFFYVYTKAKSENLTAGQPIPSSPVVARYCQRNQPVVFR
jgi:hypothetical protein